VYAGKIGGIYLDIELFQFLAASYRHWHGNFHALLLTFHDARDVSALCKEAGLPTEAITCLGVPHDLVPRYLAVADFAITPVKPVPSKRYCSPIKDGEYWAMGLPVVITADISDDSAIIEAEEAGVVLKELSETEYEKGLLKLDAILLQPRNERVQRIRHLALKYRNYNQAVEVYTKIYGIQKESYR
jgi:hypothetical protein